jgi:hypothetical protein
VVEGCWRVNIAVDVEHDETEAMKGG